jgi:signal transduction histidine kinase
MQATKRHWFFLGAAWLAVTAAGCAVVLQTELEHERVEFVLEAQGLHRLIAQQLRQHEFLADALASSPGVMVAPKAPVESPLQWLRRDAQNPWPAEQRDAFATAEARSLRSGRAVATALDLPAGHYWLVRQQGNASVALQFGLHLSPVKGATEPFAGRGDVWARLEHEGQQLPLVRAAPGLADETGGWRFGYRQRLAQDELGLDLVAVRRLGWAALPWRELASWSLLTTLLTLGAAALMVLRGGASRRGLAGDTLTLSTSFFDSDLPEPASGRTRPGAFLSAGGTRTPTTPLMVTLRELDIEPPELTVARGAIREASRQARRTSAVIDGMRRKLEDGQGSDTHIQPVALDDLLVDAVDLLKLGCDRVGVDCQLRLDPEPCLVLADPLVLEQLLHRLFGQALQALQIASPGRREIHIALERDEGHALLSISDSANAESLRQQDEAGNQRLAQSIGVTLICTRLPELGCTQRLMVPLSA